MLQSIDSENNANKQKLTTKFAYLIDPSSKLSISDIQSQLDSFIEVEPEKIPYELSEQSYWIKISIENLSTYSQNFVLFADNSLLNVFNIYQQNKAKDLITLVKHNNENKDKLKKVYPHITFELASSHNQHFVVQIQTTGPPNVPLLVLSEQDFQQRVLYTQVIFGAFIGIIMMMAMYNLVLFFALKDKVYLIYIGYLLSAFIVLSSLTGFGYLIFPDWITYQINKYLLFIDYYLVIFLLTFTLYFLRYNTQNNKTFKISMLFCIALVVCSFFSLTLDVINQTKLFFSLQPIVYLFALFIIVRRLRSDFSWAKFYILSWFPLLLGAAIQPLVLLNYLEYSFITRNAFLFAVIAEITLMAFALAERMKRNEQDRLTDIAYHITSGLPRKSNIESFIYQLAQDKNARFSVLIIKPEHIDKLALYIDDAMNTELFIRLFKRLSSLFEFNDAIYHLTDKKEKICFVNNNSFALVIDHKLNKQPLSTVIQSIQQIVMESFQVRDINLPLSAVVGVASFPEHGRQSHELINHASLAVIQGEKEYQKWATFENESSDKASYLLKLAGELALAINNDELSIYHQPQIDLRTLRVCSSECLLRWEHPVEGFIPPTIFVPIAEDMGLINQLTLWVIKQSLTQHRIITEEHHYNHMVSINISGKDISSEHFFTNALDRVEASNIPADKIIFELTESASFAYNKHALGLIEKLVDLGITISIDDFGTGYSTMSQISHLPFQELKVDREFVENVNDDKKRKIIAETTVKMAKGIGLEVVAEGINSQADEDTLRDFGCDIGQGYFYAKPMPLLDYIDWLNNLENGRIKQPLQGEFIPASKSDKS